MGGGSPAALLRDLEIAGKQFVGREGRSVTISSDTATDFVIWVASLRQVASGERVINFNWIR